MRPSRCITAGDGSTVGGQAKRPKELEKENNQLKKLVAGSSLDKAILEEAVQEKGHQQ